MTQASMVKCLLSDIVLRDGVQQNTVLVWNNDDAQIYWLLDSFKISRREYYAMSLIGIHCVRSDSVEMVYWIKDQEVLQDTVTGKLEYIENAQTHRRLLNILAFDGDPQSAKSLMKTYFSHPNKLI